MSKLSIRGPVCSTSYGLCVLNIVKSLTESGHEVSLFPIGNIDGNDIPGQFHDSLRQSLQNTQFWDVNSPSITIYHQFALAECVSRKRIGFPIFELDKFNDLELHHLKSLDQILVPSHWAKGVCQQNGLTQRIDVVPLGVDIDMFKRKEYTERFIDERDCNSPSFTIGHIRNKVGEKTTVFLSVAKKELRKFHDGLIKCFEKAFNQNDNCELWVVWGNRILQYRNPDEDRKWTEYYKKTRLPGKIRLFEWMPSQDSIIDLMNKADCFVGISRAEGWNLPLLEAMSMSMPIITNYYSGHTEFVDESNAMIIPFREKETAFDGIWFSGQGSWMSIGSTEEEYIINYMREIHRKKQNNELLLNTAGRMTAERFTWRSTAETLVKAVL